MHVRALLTAVILAGSAAVAAAQPASPSPAVIARSGFIFKGTVQTLASSNVAAVPASPSTIVVRVDQILKAPQALQSFGGRSVTIQLLRGTRLRQGQQAVFYTTSLMFGENLALRELASSVAQADTKRLTDQISAADRQAAEQAIAARIASAALVVSGKVVAVAAYTAKEDSARRSEHDPELWRADVEVGTVFKGQRPAGGRVVVFFAHSTDERWILSPKYTVGQQGIFLLHTEEMASIGQPGYSTLDRLDFQAASQAEVVRRLANARR